MLQNLLDGGDHLANRLLGARQPIGRLLDQLHSNFGQRLVPVIEGLLGQLAELANQTGLSLAKLLLGGSAQVVFELGQDCSDFLGGQLVGSPPHGVK